MPTPQEVAEIKRLTAILEGKRPEPTELTYISDTGTSNPDGVLLSKGPTREDNAAMAKILNKFGQATGITKFSTADDGITNVVSNLVETSQVDRELREALITKKEDNAVKIGAWKIKKHLRENVIGKNETIYRVSSVNTNQTIKASFLVLESARTVVKLLNQGAEVSHPVIRKVAELELTYRKQRQKALEERRSWHRAKKSNDEFKQDLYEAKFDAAKSRALLTRELIRNIYNTL